MSKISFIAICQLILVVILAGGPPHHDLRPGLSGKGIRASVVTEIPDVRARLAVLEKTIEQRRKDESIPGLSLVIVAEDKIVYLNGFGARDIDHNLPATPDTLFEIGSTTKAFTAMAAVITADEGKLQLDDPPKKFLPYFKLRDSVADSSVTLRDLLSHRTGLKEHDDGAWLDDEKRTREEVIRTAMMSKPTAKFREKFQYNNVMYSAAGECIARAQNSTWEQVIRTRILEPLGMKASAPSIVEVRDVSNLSVGYKPGKTPKAVRQRDLTNIAPAGAIISDARDMAQWLRLMLGRGVIDGKRLVSENGFNELVSKQISVQEGVDYGLGWGIFRWHDRNVLTHTGGTEGFSSHVELMPDQNIGFAVLCNTPEAKLMKEIRKVIWAALLDIH